MTRKASRTTTGQSNTLRSDQSGAGAVEFAMLAPVFILMLIGVLQAGVWLQNFNAVRSTTHDASRMILIQYQKNNELSDEQIRRIILARATTAPYFLNTDNLTININRLATTRVTGTTEIEVELQYVFDSFLPFAELPGSTVAYERPVFVVAAPAAVGGGG